MKQTPQTPDATGPVHGPDDEISRVLEYLDRTHLEAKPKPSSRFEERVIRFSKWSLAMSVAGFALMAALALWHRYVSPLPQYLIGAALVSGALSVLSALLQLASFNIVGCMAALRFRTETALRKLQTLQHDLRIVAPLHAFSADALQHLDAWLASFIAREERRISLLLPGAEKTAILSYVALSFGVMTTFLSTWSDIQKHVPWLAPIKNLDPWAIIIPAALLFGMAVGSMLARLNIQRMQHQRDLLALALKLRPAGA
jgi:hypothetical protein